MKLSTMCQFLFSLRLHENLVISFFFSALELQVTMSLISLDEKTLSKRIPYSQKSVEI